MTGFSRRSEQYRDQDAAGFGSRRDESSERPGPYRRALHRVTQCLAYRPVAFGLKAIVSIALIGFVTRKIAGFTLWHQFETQAPRWLAAAALLTAAQVVLGALRWHQVLRGLGETPKFAAVLRVTYASSFFNAWLFGVVAGDAARALLIPARDKGRTTMVHSVLFDRILTLAGLGLVVVPGVVRDMRPFGRDPAVLLALCVAAAPILMLTAAAFVLPVLRFVGGKLSAPLVGLVHGWRGLLRARARFAATLAIAAASQVALAAVAYCLARAQHLDVTVLDFIMLMPPVVLLVTLPVSAGGWGVREGAMVAMLGTIGVASGPALLISVEMGALAALISLPAGALWALRYGFRPAPVAVPGA